jgi:hypothetical protein
MRKDEIIKQIKNLIQRYTIYEIIIILIGVGLFLLFLTYLPYFSGILISFIIILISFIIIWFLFLK